MLGSGKSTVWTIMGTILISVSVIALIFASAFPYWQQAEKARDTGIKSIGLWAICVRDDGYAVPNHVNDILGQRYYGCNYVFNRDLRMIVDWIYPAWFKVVVIFVTLGLITQPLCIILNVLYYAGKVSAHREHILLLSSSIINFAEGLLIAIAIIIFGLKSAKDALWMPNPESNYLSYSYGVCALVPVLCFLAGMCHFVDFLRVNSYKVRDARAKTYARGEFARY